MVSIEKGYRVGIRRNRRSANSCLKYHWHYLWLIYYASLLLIRETYYGKLYNGSKNKHCFEFELSERDSATQGLVVFKVHIKYEFCFNNFDFRCLLYSGANWWAHKALKESLAQSSQSALLWFMQTLDVYLPYRRYRIAAWLQKVFSRNVCAIVNLAL